MSHSPDTAADRAEIADLVHLYALHIRRGAPEQAAALFTADGAFEVRDMDPGAPDSLTVRNRAEGCEAVAAYVANATRSARMVPMIHNLIVELDGDRAAGSSLMVGRIWPTRREVIGEYSDSFRREGRSWLFSERIYTIWREPD